MQEGTIHRSDGPIGGRYDVIITSSCNSPPKKHVGDADCKQTDCKQTEANRQTFCYKNIHIQYGKISRQRIGPF